MLKVREPNDGEIDLLKPGAILLGLLRPGEQPEGTDERQTAQLNVESHDDSPQEAG